MISRYGIPDKMLDNDFDVVRSWFSRSALVGLAMERCEGQEDDIIVKNRKGSFIL